MAWTKTLASPGQELARQGAWIRIDWALGLAVHGLLAKWIFSLIIVLVSFTFITYGIISL